jgi:hypothetical protein
LELVLGPKGNGVTKKKKRLKKTICAWLLTNRKDAWEKDQRYHRLSSESGIPKKESPF